jgi:Concanavalin A-like lectin/glucanases superfamily
MPLAIDIFNKKVLSRASNFGTFNVLLSGDAAGSALSQPTLLNVSSQTVNIPAATSSSFYASLTGSKTFTYTSFETGQYINLYLKADHTGNGVEHTFPSATLFDKYGTQNKIYTHSGYITRVELLNHPYGYLGTSDLIKYDYVTTGTQNDPYSDYVTLLMHFNTTGVDRFPTGALAFWKLDDVTDSINGNTLANNGDVQFVAGKIGDCAQFDETNSLSNNSLSSQFNPDGEFTISIWINPASFTSFQSFIGGQTFNIHTDAGATINFNNALQGDASTPNGTLQLDVWQHIVCSVNATNSKIWVNGSVLYDEPTEVSYSRSDRVVLGNYIVGNTSFSYNGKLDMVGIWNRELTEQEIQQLYNGGDGLEP